MNNLSIAGGRSLISAFVLEALLTLGLVYVIGRVTLVLAPGMPGNFDVLLAAGAALPLAASVTLARQTRRRFHGSLAQEVTLVSMLTATVVAITMTVMWAFGDAGDRELAFAIMVESAIIVPGAAFGWRWLAGQLRVPGFCSERLIILGTGHLAQNIFEYVSAQRGAEFDVVGFVRCEEEPVADGIWSSAPVLDLDSLSMLNGSSADRIVVALSEKRGTLPVRQLIDLRLKGVPVEESTSFIERSSGKIHVQALLPSWLIFSDGFRISPWRAFMKRSGDFALACLALAAAAPVMLLTTIAIRLEGPGSILYRQDRVGLDGQPFEILKFRSMVPNAEELTGPAWCEEDDPRITRVGRLMRKLRIDELPQIWNVLKGEMSFVGPRPERPVFVDALKREIPFYGLRHCVRPGITGWAQVKYRYGSSKDDSLEKLKYDLFYIKNASFLLDIWIVIKTVKVVLFASGSR